MNTIILVFIVGGFCGGCFGVVGMALLSGKAYEKGFKDGKTF